MTEPKKLTDEIKEYIVTELACYKKPSAVAKAVKEEFGIEVSRQAVHCYDPTVKAGEGLSEPLRLLFEKTRKAFREDIESIPESHRTVRVRRLAEAAEKASENGNFVLMASLLEQIAKEMGGVFSNRRELSGPNGGAIPIENVHSLSDEELAAIASIGRSGAAAPAPGQAEPDRVRQRD